MNNPHSTLCIATWLLISELTGQPASLYPLTAFHIMKFSKKDMKSLVPELVISSHLDKSSLASRIITSASFEMKIVDVHECIVLTAVVRRLLPWRG